MITFGFQTSSTKVVTLTFDRGHKDIILERALRELNFVAFSKGDKHWINPTVPVLLDTKQKVYTLKRLFFIILGFYPHQLDCLPDYEDDTKLKGLKELISWD